MWKSSAGPHREGASFLAEKAGISRCRPTPSATCKTRAHLPSPQHLHEHLWLHGAMERGAKGPAVSPERPHQVIHAWSAASASHPLQMCQRHVGEAASVLYCYLPPNPTSGATAETSVCRHTGSNVFKHSFSS